jgi:hypothetical protein
MEAIHDIAIEKQWLQELKKYIVSNPTFLLDAASSTCLIMIPWWYQNELTRLMALLRAILN